MEKRIILTRKIQLLIDSDDAEQRKGIWETLFLWQRICFRAANYIFTHHFIQSQLKELIYITDELKVKLADIKKDADGILTTSKANTTYRILSSHFKGELPSDIFSNLNNTLVRVFNQENLAYLKGEKSVRNYKRDIPIPFSGSQIKLKQTEKYKEFSFSWFGIPFKTYLGKDRSDKRVLLQRAMTGDNKLCTSSIKLDKGKIYLLAAFEMEQEQHQLKDAVIAEASLSIEHPISVQIGKTIQAIGNKEEFLYRRMAIQAARHRLQKAAAFCKGGRGRKRKLKNMDDYSQKEKRYVDQKLHVYSRKLIDFCIKCGAGTLLLVNQSQKEEVAKDEEFLLRNWSYYGLKEKIAYKAQKAGITLIEE